MFALPRPGFQIHSTPASLGRMRVPPSPAVSLCSVARLPQGTLQHNSQRWVFGRRKLSLRVVLVAEVLWGTAADSFKLTALEKKFCIVKNFPGNLVPGLVSRWEFYCTDVASTQNCVDISYIDLTISTGLSLITSKLWTHPQGVAQKPTQHWFCHDHSQCFLQIFPTAVAKTNRQHFR